MEGTEQSGNVIINFPKYIYIKGYQLNYKSPPLKGNIHRYRCRNRSCKYFIKIDSTNLKKIINNDKDNISYTEINQHENHKENIIIKMENGNAITEEGINKLARQLITLNLNEPLDFHLANFKNNSINWKKGKIRKLLYSIREEKYPKDQIFMQDISNIKIQLSDNKEVSNECFCISKGEFINFSKNKNLERYFIFASQFQLKLYNEVDELFIDGTFKVAPKNWLQLINIFGFIRKKKIYIPLTYALLSSKSEELYDEFFTQLIRNIKTVNKDLCYEELKIMSDFELSLRKSIRKNFKGCILQGCYFHFCKSIWKKIKKLHLFKKEYRYNTIILAFVMKVYPFIKGNKKEVYYNKIENFCDNLKGNYINLKNYFRR